MGEDKLASLTSPKGKPAAPAPSETPKPEAQGNGAGQRLVGLWANGCKTRKVVFGDRGKVSGLLAGMLKNGHSEDQLAQAIGRWWNADRPDYGIGLFKARLDGGNRELTDRAVESSVDTLAEANSRGPTAEDLAIFGDTATGGGQ